MKALNPQAWAVGVTFILLGLLSVTSLQAASVPSRAMMQQLQGLSSEQRQALIEYLQTQPTGTSALNDETSTEDDASVLPTTLTEPEEVILKPHDKVLIRFTLIKADKDVPIEVSTEKEPRPRSAVYRIDYQGRVILPEAGPVLLAGLTEEQASQRLSVIEDFSGYEITLTYLPVKDVLAPFGYELFTQQARRNRAPRNVPVPAEYVVGPGDSIHVQLFGKKNAEHDLVVSRDGMLKFPGIGPISVAGLTFEKLDKRIRYRVKRQLIGVKASVSLGRIRTIQVFLAGDVNRPGALNLSGLSTMTHALMVSGGVTDIGSLRNIQLKRRGKVVKRFDLYDLLLKGDSSQDARLLPGDVIFVPPLGKTVGVKGRVRRPATYELRDEKSLSEVIQLAGGLPPEAYPGKAAIERITADKERIVIDANLNTEDGRRLGLRDGDVITVSGIGAEFDQAVILRGAVHRPLAHQWRQGMRITDLIPSLRELVNDADPRYILIKRRSGVVRKVSVLQANLLKALANPESDANVLLRPLDDVVVFLRHEDRDRVIEPLLDILSQQSSPEQPTGEVTIHGVVHHSGRYPLSYEMQVQDLIDAAGGLKEEAYTLEAELTRFEVVGEGNQRQQKQVIVQLKKLAQGVESENIKLQPYDQLVIRKIPQWDKGGTINIVGEVKFPGSYPIGRGEKLYDVIQRAGGITDESYIEGAVFVRESVRAREKQYLEQLAAQLERDVAIAGAQEREAGEDKDKAVAEAQTVLKQLRQAKATGRMVINLQELLNQNSSYNITVQPGDKLYIPQKPEEVTVIGEVHHPTSHLQIEDYTRNDYVRLSGGVTERGNKRAIYVVHANGAVTPTSGWFGGDADVGPGDTIVVPLKIDRISGLRLFTDISQVVYQLALTAASLKVLEIF